MQDRTILDVGRLSDVDAIHVPSKNTAEPHAGVLRESDVADDVSARCHIGTWMNHWPNPSIGQDHQLTSST